ncbi:MAG: protein kinase, partial [Anaerolineales bacterium]
ADSDHTIPGKHQITPAIPGQTLPGTVMGTPAYMSPEQVEGRDVSERSDVYALGIVAYEMIAGKPPFSADDNAPAPVMYMQVHKPPPLIPNLKPGVTACLQRALAKDPADRFECAGAFTSELAKAIQAKETTFEITLKRLKNLPRQTWAAVGAGMFLSISALIIGVLSTDSNPVETLDPTLPVEESQQEPENVELTMQDNPRSSGGTISSTSVPTPSPTAWPTPAQDVRERLDLDSPAYLDSFDEKRWYTYDAEDKASYRIEDGKLIGRDYEPEEIYTWWSRLIEHSGNLYAEVSAQNGDCIGKDSVGMAIRVDEQTAKGGYAIEISCDGYWRLRLHRKDSIPREISGWAPSDAINRGPYAENRIGLFAYRDQFYVYINGQPVSYVRDKAYSRSFGNFALYVRSSMTYDLEAQFDDFALWHVRYVP